jgi:DNA-directed RNA polymerase specialized sigma24 family protein
MRRVEGHNGEESGTTNDSPHLKKDWIPTKESFDRLLACLDEDREQAGKMYVNTQARLVKFFEWRGSEAPDNNADETINRVTRKISEGETIQNLQSYIYGVARMVLMEALKEQEKQRQWRGQLPPPIHITVDHTEKEARGDCVISCLEVLPGEERILFVQYHEGEKRARIERRKALADGLKIPLNALRIRVHRIRLRLEQCVIDCLQNSVGEMK